MKTVAVDGVSAVTHRRALRDDTIMYMRGETFGLSLHLKG